MKFTKILSAVAVIGMLACTSAFAANATLTLSAEKTTVAPGDTVSVTLSVTANPGIVGFQGIFDVDGIDALSAKPTDKKTLTGSVLGSNKSLPYSVLYSDETEYDLDGGEEIPTDTGAIAIFKFKVPETAANNQTYTVSYTVTKVKDYYQNTITCNNPSSLTITVEKASTTSIGTATVGGDLDGDKTFYAPITIDTSAQTGARFQVSKGGKTKDWEIPSGIVGKVGFIAVVKTADPGEYTYNVVSATGTAIGTEQTVTIQ